jgi:GrpB-like predicted nucleotidyltransferase (UPF0157 family)
MLHPICYKEVSMVGSTTLIGMTSKKNVDVILELKKTDKSLHSKRNENITS